MDQRRILLAFVLMTAVLVASQWWYSQLESPADERVAPVDSVAGLDRSEGGAPTETARPEAPGDTTEDTPRGPGRETVSSEPPTDTAADTAGAVGRVGNRLLEGRSASERIRVETPLYVVEIDPEGGTVRGVSLKPYDSFVDPGPVQLVPEGEAILERFADLGGETPESVADLVFAPSDTAISLAAADSGRTLTLAWDDGARRIVQQYRFEPDSYVIDYALDLGRTVDGVLVTGIAPRLRSNEKNTKDDYNQMRGVARVDEEVVSRSAGDVDEEPYRAGGAVGWAGIKNKYFLAAVLSPSDGTLRAVTISGSEADGELPELTVEVASPIADGESRYRLYLGPQEYRRLADVEAGLDEVNQYGWSWINWMITPFAKLIVVVMLWLHQFIPSYGLVLIVFAVGVRTLIAPLTAKSFRSIQAMQKLQPQIQEIRERHKDDPQKMQRETMRLYREKKVNPLGGCLPNLIPMPILFALFFVFQSTIEFRGQAFLWLPDLAQPDPFYVLPVVMGASMFMSSKLMQTDPKMSAMTYVMPVVLTFVFLNLAAGLVLYYTLSNLLTFGQQWWLRRGSSVETEADDEGG